MKKGNHEFYILLKDIESSRFAYTGPMETHLLNDWYGAADARDVVALDVRPKDLQAECRFLLDSRWVEVEPADLVDEPIDRANHYFGKLPAYASDTDRSKVINIVCRDCCKVRWAILNKPFPGFERLKTAGMAEYRAICLKCGYSATDNYNWSRP
ncbi:hypothetical protein ALP36_02002 [Pseudomonas syringae pv. coriandricola]|uniref:Uncharacterized protein n=1 Tax=Pseudomonas syringae pv. coriandricola TaxID=264453 RepID=A0A3M4UFS6_9PSED|nr:hypothetical protein [Pseudomonas syringae group genomosp. 3]RMR37942.1 hypothetical protein ALP87_03388 [Pseudomonas syringae pv. coriandricola]RMU08278.1 hypothetical protein ALP36_02002 [Pseudomonas syringae pv. coriandricola]